MEIRFEYIEIHTSRYFALRSRAVSTTKKSITICSRATVFKGHGFGNAQSTKTGKLILHLIIIVYFSMFWFFLNCSWTIWCNVKNKQHIAAIEEQLVWLIISAMERTEEEPTRITDNEDSFTSIHWLWAHISSQLIYFVLLQYASFPNIVSTLHEKVKKTFFFF